ncbi:hypothetical protein DFH09DRAFT_1374641 [Mycena vulgaris]|nr:hypothetical protein DFH09DRAFT_1374641 [Mycena vulgaris]
MPANLPKEWWEVWQSTGEQNRKRTYNLNLDRLDRFRAAAMDFQQDNKIKTNQLLQSLWDHFRNFTGISETRSNDFDARSENQASEFFNDPARSIQRFLSSYMRTQGLIWNQRKLVAAPHLLRFFVNFLLRNRVLPENTHNLKNALDTIAVAELELPLLPQISEALPDEFSRAAESVWGRKADEVYLPSRSDKHESKVKATESHLAAAVTNNRKKETDDRGHIQVVHGVDASADGGWGSGGWEHTGEWSTMPQESLSSWVDPSSKDSPRSTQVKPLLPPASMFRFLGPTVLPLSHAPGVVEFSIRRIKSLVPPTAPSTPASSQPVGEWAPAPEAVERAVEAGMYRMLMEPWLDWDADPATARTRILRSSSGAVVVPGQPSASGAHDMLTDEITVLVDPAVVNTVRVGMGIGGTWVQLTRLQNAVTRRRNRKKAQKNNGAIRYWYLQDVIFILPSYWAI